MSDVLEAQVQLHCGIIVGGIMIRFMMMMMMIITTH